MSDVNKPAEAKETDVKDRTAAPENKGDINDKDKEPETKDIKDKDKSGSPSEEKTKEKAEEKSKEVPKESPKEAISDSDVVTVDEAEKESEIKLEPVTKKRSALSKSQKKKIRIVVIIVIIAILLITGFLVIRKNIKDGMQALRDQMAPNLTPAEVERRDLTENISVTGKIRSNETRTQITALQTTNGQGAKILTVNVEVGDYVNEGDVLVTFSTEDIEKSIARTQEDLARQRKLDSIQAADSQRNYVYSYQQAAESLENNAKNVDRALKNLYEACDAYGDAKRALQEAKDDGEPDLVIENLENVVSQAKAAEEKAQQAYDDAVRSEASSGMSGGTQYIQNTLSTADSDYQKSQISAGQQAQSYSRNLQDQQDRLDDYVVEASMSGLVTSVKVSEGNNFSSGEVLTIQDVSKLKVDAEVDEYDIWKVKKGQRVLVKTEATGDEEFDAVVSLIHPTATAASASAAAGGTSTPTYTVTVDLLDKDERLMLGMTAKMSIVVDQKSDVLCVPYDAIGQNSDGEPIVYVLDDMSLLDDNKKEPEKPKSKFEAILSVFKKDGDKKEADKDSSGKKGTSEILVENNISGTERKVKFPGSPSDEPEALSEEDMYHEIVVKTGMETDYYTEIITDELKEGDYIVIKNEDGGNDLFNMMMGGMPPG